MAINKPEEAHSTFAAAMNVGDLNSLCALYEGQAKMVPEPGKAPVSGIVAIRAVLQAFLASKPQITIETQSLIQAEEIALLRGRWHLKGTDADGKPMEMTGNSNEVVRRQADGTWLYLIDHPFGAD